jgi:RNA polymerase sigma factor (sigma-70 family)
MSDWRLLREYAEKKSEGAFAELVDKHMKLVYGTCRRDLGDAQLAEDAAMAVFVLLAQKANSLGRNVGIPGWLFKAARLIASNAARVERRRRHYEEEAVRRMDHDSQREPVWDDIGPWLNDALATLTPAEREVVLLRYFGDMSFHEIAAQIGTIENTAAKRARYAIEKMRRYMAKKEVAVSSATLTALLAGQHANAAPASCHAATLQAIHQLATGQGAALAASSHLALLHKGVTILMDATIKKAAIAGGIILLVGGGVAVTAVKHHAPASQAAASSEQGASSTATDQGPAWTSEVQWATAHSADPATRTAEQQIQAQIGRYFHGTVTRNKAECMAVMSPNCINLNNNYHPYQGLATHGVVLFPGMTELHITAKINSFHIDGNTAIVGFELSRSMIKSARRHDTKVFTTDTFTNTGGQWLITSLK